MPTAAAGGWPHFAAKALAGGVSAVYSFPLRNLDQHVGSIGLFNEAAEQVTAGDLRLRRTSADEITRG